MLVDLNRAAVHSTDTKGDRSGRANAVPEMPGRGLSHRGDPLGTGRTGTAGRYAPEGANRWNARDQRGAKVPGFGRVHVLGSK